MNTKKYKNIIVALAALLMMGCQAVAQEYFQGKAEVVVLDNLRSGHKENLNGLDVKFIEGDICDRAAVKEAMQGVDYVFHLAAMISVPESMFKIAECIKINNTGN